MKKDIFISYRRKGAEHLALLMYHQLRQDGYTVFLDVETLHNGKYNEALLSRIEESTDVILILPPHALDTCHDPEDWVRKEVECALRHNKNIIPIMMEGFHDWPKDLPDTMQDVLHFNGLKNYHGYFSDMMRKLEKDFLESTPSRTSAQSGIATDDEPSLISQCTACGSTDVTVADPLPNDVMYLLILRKAISWWIWLTASIFILIMVVTAFQDQSLTLFGISLDFIYQLPLIRMIEYRPATYLHFIIITACLLLLGNAAYKYSSTQPILELENERRTVTVTCKRCTAKRRVTVPAECLGETEHTDPDKVARDFAVPVFLAVPALYFSCLDILWKTQMLTDPADVFHTITPILLMLALFVLHRIAKVCAYLTNIPKKTFREYLQSDITGEPYKDEEPVQQDGTDLTLKEKVIRFAKPDYPINNEKEDE